MKKKFAIFWRSNTRETRVLPIICALLVFAGCTITPKPVHDRVASFDGNAQNSGFIGFAPQGGGYITAHARDRYNLLIVDFGKRFQPPLLPDAGVTATATNGVYHIDAKHLVDFGVMNGWRKNGTATRYPSQ